MPSKHVQWNLARNETTFFRSKDSPHEVFEAISKYRKVPESGEPCELKGVLKRTSSVSSDDFAHYATDENVTVMEISEPSDAELEIENVVEKVVRSLTTRGSVKSNRMARKIRNTRKKKSANKKTETTSSPQVASPESSVPDSPENEAVDFPIAGSETDPQKHPGVKDPGEKSSFKRTDSKISLPGDVLETPATTPAAAMPKYDFYQTSQSVVISIYMKNAAPGQVSVDFQRERVCALLKPICLNVLG
jgi:hypothetical protein